MDSIQAESSFTESLPMSAIEAPSTRTLSASGLSLLPAQTGQVHEAAILREQDAHMSLVAAAFEPAEKSAHSRPAILVELAMRLRLSPSTIGLAPGRGSPSISQWRSSSVISRNETAVRILRLRASLIIHSLIS